MTDPAGPGPVVVAPSAPPDVVVVGNLTIDDVVHADGATTMASPGGNAIHAATGARIWGVSVGIVARVGEDFPDRALAAVRDAGIDTLGLHPVTGPTVRSWIVYETDGRRTWVYRTPPARSGEVAPAPGDIPPAWIGPSTGSGDGRARVVHVAAMPFAAAAAVVDHVRASGPAVIVLDTHEGWDERRDQVVALACRVDVFVPSREELAATVGFDDPARAGRELVADGVAVVVVKCGADGAVVATRAEAGTVAVAAAPDVTVVDVTGAGDSFCGGLAAGLALGEDLPAAVRRGVATAGAAIGASGSLRVLRRVALAERLLARSGESAAASDPPASAPAGRLASAPAGPLASATDDSDVMEREIASIPAVIRARLDMAGQAAPTVERLRESGTRQLVLVGCGDSSFACQAATLALNRHSGLVVRSEHALDFARYGVRYQPAGTAVVVVSFSGQTGRTIEAARQAHAFGHLVIALTGDADSPIAKEADCVLPAEIPTFGFSPGTSTYTAMLVTLLAFAAALGDGSGGGSRGAEDRSGAGSGAAAYASGLDRLPSLAEDTLRLGADAAYEAAGHLVGAQVTTFLGAGPSEATARFGAAKLFEGAQQLAVVTNVEEWAHEQYFVTRPGDPVVLVAPRGASSDRAAEILSEITYVGASPIVVSDVAPPGPALHLPVAAGVAEDLSPVLTSLPLSQLGLHLMRRNGKRSYNFPDDDARREHYDTIHRVTIGEPA
jgi:sugar/nucleoside kinase (ribokinase family)/fructoselysine-6-P-deglycase FrlB-like protein